MLSYLLAAIAFGVLIAFHEFGHMWVARRVGMRVERFSIGFGPVIYRKQVGETEYALSAVPLGGYVKIAGMAPEDEVSPEDPRNYQNRPAWARLLVMAAGPGANYLLAFLIGVPLLMATAMHVDDLSTPRIGAVVPGEPAAVAGLEEGDRVFLINDKMVKDFDGIRFAVNSLENEHPGSPIHVAFLRGGDPNPKAVSITPRQSGDRWIIGVNPSEKELPPMGFVDAVGSSFANLGHQTGENVTMLKMLFTRQAGVHDLAGPVGIVTAVAAKAKRGFGEYFHIVWSLSIAIGFFNLLPIPALDGGRGVFLLWELVSRRKMNQRIEAAIHTVGLVALFGLILFVTRYDILRKIKGG